MTERARWMIRLVTRTALGLSFVLATTVAVQAQKKKAEPAAKRQSAWVKLCEKTKLKRADKKGKLTDVSKNICLTQHERLNGNNGTVLISVAVRKIDDQKKDHLMIMVPLGMAIPPGIKAAVYTPEQWQKVLKKEKVDDKALKPISLRFTLCYQAGCTAEAPAPDDLVENMKKGGGLMVIALEGSGRPAAFPVPLVGFAEAHEGKPVDIQKYGAARAQLMEKIRENMRRKIVEKRTGGRVPEPKKVK